MTTIAWAGLAGLGASAVCVTANIWAGPTIVGAEEAGLTAFTGTVATLWRALTTIDGAGCAGLAHVACPVAADTRTGAAIAWARPTGLRCAAGAIPTAVRAVIAVFGTGGTALVISACTVTASWALTAILGAGRAALSRSTAPIATDVRAETTIDGAAPTGLIEGAPVVAAHHWTDPTVLRT